MRWTVLAWSLLGIYGLLALGSVWVATANRSSTIIVRLAHC